MWLCATFLSDSQRNPRLANSEPGRSIVTSGNRLLERLKVAVARELVVLLRRLWVTGEHYQPLGYSKGLPA